MQSKKRKNACSDRKNRYRAKKNLNVIDSPWLSLVDRNLYFFNKHSTTFFPKMAGKKQTATSSTTAAATPKPEATPVATPAPASAPEEKKSRKTKAPQSDEPVAAPAPAKADATTESSPPEKKARKSKAAATAASAATTDVSSSSSSAATTATAGEGKADATEDTACVVDEAVSVEQSMVSRSAEFISSLQTISGEIAKLKNEYKTLARDWSREFRALQKNNSKKKKRNVNRKPSGFRKPALISDEMAAFLGKEPGTEMARTDVTKEINLYIVNNALRDKDNGRIIHPDGPLADLLKIDQGAELTYFNLQKFMSPHFIGSPAAAAAAAAAK